MNHLALVERMATFPGAVAELIRGVSDEDARWRPASGAWSILEIVCHLGDEEVEDFRARVRSTLEDPERAWTPIDPEGWATQRAYNEADLGEAIERLAREREVSVQWLRSLESPDWSRAWVHPKFGPQRAGDVMVSWAAHDALHLRQLAKRLYELGVRDGGGFDAGYAGDW